MNELRLTFEPQALEAVRTIFREELDRRAEELRKKPKSLTRHETCKALKVSLPTLDKMLREGRINYKKISRRVFIPENAIKEFLETR